MFRNHRVLLVLTIFFNTIDQVTMHQIRDVQRNGFRVRTSSKGKISITKGKRWIRDGVMSIDAQWPHRKWRVRLWLGPSQCWPVNEDSWLGDSDFDRNICKSFYTIKVPFSLIFNGHQNSLLTKYQGQCVTYISHPISQQQLSVMLRISLTCATFFFP